MSTSQNVQLLKAYLGALQASDGEKMASMLHPELQYWVSPGSAFSGTHDRSSLLALLPAIFDAQAGPTRLTYREITAQDDRVSLVADGTMPLIGPALASGSALRDTLSMVPPPLRQRPHDQHDRNDHGEGREDP